ncbi:MAG: flagellar export chaperone FlgN, partial [Planctomycetota bacterium]|nr:flagellar export chaperone FlgN [Planctomycetota bacterium]
METAWDSELANLMTDLLATQDETLRVLARKRELLLAGDGEGLAALDVEEQRLVERLQGSLDRREQLLKLAAEQGLPHKNLQSLSESLPKGTIGRERRDQLKLAKARARLLRHHGLTNWVVAQRTLIHLSQMLEIIATGGRLRPTYDNVQPGAHGNRQGA